MAKRRMFMENLIESDEFCALPHASQALYFHLNMAADDDGLVGNPQRILRSLKIQKKYFETLVSTGFVLSFESGVVAITHWLSNNNIRKDRYTPTRYKYEFSLLKIQDDAIYIKGKEAISADIPLPNGNRSASQASIVKDSIVESSIDKESKGKLRKEKISEDKVISVEEREEKESLGHSHSENGIKKEPIEDSFEKDEFSSVSLKEEECENRNLSFDRFVSSVRLFLMTEYKTIDDRGFIDYYSKRGFLDENNHPIIAEYKTYIRAWMKKHP